MAAWSSGSQLDARAGAPSYETLGHLLGGVADPGSVRHRDDDRLGDGAPRQVVQQPQRRLVGVLQVVDDDQQPVAGRGQAHQLRDRDEQSLVAGLPVQVTSLAGERPLDLEPEPVVEPVEQRGVLAAQLAERLEHRARRATAPRRPRRCRGRSASRAGGRAPRRGRSPRSCRRRGDRRTTGCCPGPRRRGVIASRIWSPTLRRPTRRTPWLALPVRPDWACSRARSRSASGLGVVPSSRTRAWSSRSNWRSAARTSPRSACPLMRARWAASSVASSASTSSQRSAWRSSSTRVIRTTSRASSAQDS